MPEQEQVFAQLEADNWFRRNQDYLQRYTQDQDPILGLIDLYQLNPRKVVELGAANGYRVAAISEKYGAEGVAIEPSEAAIADGKARFSRVRFVQSVIAEVDMPEVFDLVVVNFVLHWVDRRNLLRSIAQIDRLLSDQGHLIIGDFSPVNRLRVPYHHLPDQDLYTYKQNYAATFLASGLYHPVAFITRDHASYVPKTDVSEQNRVGVWLLQKKLSEHYSEARLV